jgi:hypothetical protein
MHILLHIPQDIYAELGTYVPSSTCHSAQYTFTARKQIREAEIVQ